MDRSCIVLVILAHLPFILAWWIIHLKMEMFIIAHFLAGSGRWLMHLELETLSLIGSFYGLHYSESDFTGQCDPKITFILTASGEKYIWK